MCNYKNAELLVFVSNSVVLPAGLHSVGNTVLLLPLTVVLVLLCGLCEIGVVVHEPALHVLQFLQLEADFQSKTTTTVDLPAGRSTSKMSRDRQRVLHMLILWHSSGKVHGSSAPCTQRTIHPVMLKKPAKSLLKL